jgi:formamidopyrimidine-DNA glycosylase
MPELPDLEVYATNLTHQLAGCKVIGVQVVRPKRVHASEEELSKALVGSKIKRFQRAGKQMRILFDNGQTLGVHLMLNGELQIVKGDESAKNVSLLLKLEDDSTLAITDRQAWVTVELNPADSDVPDALDKYFTLEYFTAEAMSKGKTPIKMLLVDQEVVQGIGNAYADEILWHAKVDPESPSGKVPEDQLGDVYRSVWTVLKAAVKSIAKNHPGLINGEPRDHMAVHNKERIHSPTGAEIKTKEVKGKKTYYTDEQKLWK